VRLVLDTNVVISAFINPAGTPARIVSMVLNRRAELCYNSLILGEYEGVALRPKFAEKINAGAVCRFVDLIRSFGISFDPAAGAVEFTDESDRIFYDTAKGSGSLLVTGNTKHFPKESFILSPADFLGKCTAEHISSKGSR
jgi:putative PIN family toxin of toxin-antitoxin system